MTNQECTACDFEFHEIPYVYKGKFYCRSCADKLPIIEVVNHEVNESNCNRGCMKDQAEHDSLCSYWFTNGVRIIKVKHNIEVAPESCEYCHERIIEHEELRYTCQHLTYNTSAFVCLNCNPPKK